MLKGIYTRTKPVWNKGLRGYQTAWNKGKGIVYDPKVLERAKQLFNSYLPTAYCEKILTEEFGTKVRLSVFWRRIFSMEERKNHRHILLSRSKLGEKNPMKRIEVRINNSNSHKGKIPWNKNLNGEEYKKHYPNGIKGGRPKGYQHTLESRRNMSKNTLGKKHPNYNPSLETRKKSSKRMKLQRQNFGFNKKMFESLTVSITKPHKKVIEWVKQYTNLNTISNYCIKVGKIFGSIDEADPKRKVAIYVDGNYWHNYPNGRRWDRTCDTFLRNREWVVLRFWESDIKNNPLEIINKLKLIDDDKKNN